MKKVLWALQVLLALAFAAHGLMLLFPPASIAEQMNASMSREFQVFLGVAEVLAAVGVTLPGLTGIQPWWTQWAALGIMIVMISATIFHVMRNEISSAATTLVLLAMATYVAYMRWKVVPIVPWELAAPRPSGDCRFSDGVRTAHGHEPRTTNDAIVVSGLTYAHDVAEPPARSDRGPGDRIGHGGRAAAGRGRELNGQIVRTAAATLRVSAIKGFVYPWALAFLPNGDMLVTEQGRNTLRLVHNGALDPTPITGLPQGITSTRRDTAGVDIAVHPRFAENRYIYVAYWKPKPVRTAAKGANIRTAVLIRARYDGGPALTDVREIFASASWTDGPSAARLVFGRDGKIYMAIGAPGFATERGTTVVGAGARRARRQDPAAERRWNDAAGQSVRGTSRLQAGDLRARHSQRARPDASIPRPASCGRPRTARRAATRSTSSAPA